MIQRERTGKTQTRNWKNLARQRGVRKDTTSQLEYREDTTRNPKERHKRNGEELRDNERQETDSLQIHRKQKANPY